MLASDPAQRVASWPARPSDAQHTMLTVRDIAALPGLGLELVAGAAGGGNVIRWVHVSELPDPTPWLEGGELLITTGLGIGQLSRPQREYVRRLAGPGPAGLAFR